MKYQYARLKIKIQQTVKIVWAYVQPLLTKDGAKKYAEQVWQRIKPLYEKAEAHYHEIIQPKLEPYIERSKPYIEKAKERFWAWIKTFEKQDPETAFYPGALEVLETPPSPLGRTIALVICAFFVFAFLWALIGTVDIIATAQGKIIPTGRTKVIQPMDSGVVKLIHVQNGDSVKEGDILIEIDTTISEAERSRLEKDLIVAQLDVARLNAALDIDKEATKLDKSTTAATTRQKHTQQAQLDNQIIEIRAKLMDADQQILQQRSNSMAILATIAKLGKSIPLLKKRLEMRKYLSENGYGSKLDTLTTEQQLIEAQQDWVAQQNKFNEALSGVESVKEQRGQIEAAYRNEILEKLALAEQKVASLTEQLVQATETFDLQTLKAPVSGTIQDLSIHTVGGIVTPAQKLLSIVPTDSRLEVEAMISNRDIGFVQVDDEVKLKIDTFNFTKYGFVHGKILSIANNAIIRQKPVPTSEGNKNGAENESSEPTGQEFVYSTRISMDNDVMIVEDRKVKLSPGMAVTAEIRTGTRRVIEFLLSPILRHQQQSLQER